MDAVYAVAPLNSYVSPLPPHRMSLKAVAVMKKKMAAETAAARARWWY